LLGWSQSLARKKVRQFLYAYLNCNLMSNLPLPCAVVFSKDVRKMADFYIHLFGMESVESGEAHEVLAVPGFELVIHGIPTAIAKSIEICNPPLLREDSPIKICLPVANLAEARKIAEQFGGYLGPKEKQWEARGFRACDGYDPEGNIVQARESVA
jgi:predicted enzyme related to lactoylglutathione lyase